MPIKPENKARYPADWQAIRARVIKRANDCCELCFIENAKTYWRNAETGEAWSRWEIVRHNFDPDSPPPWLRPVRIVLTVAHINQQPEDNRDVNLRALCQRCHNLIDLPYRVLNAAATRDARKLTLDAPKSPASAEEEN